MGVGTPDDILGAGRAGVDMFDCVLRPARPHDSPSRASVRSISRMHASADPRPLDAESAAGRRGLFGALSAPFS